MEEERTKTDITTERNPAKLGKHMSMLPEVLTPYPPPPGSGPSKPQLSSSLPRRKKRKGKKRTNITTITADAEPPGKKTSEEGSEKDNGHVFWNADKDLVDKIDFCVFWNADTVPVNNGISLADGTRFIRDFVNYHMGRKVSITIWAYTTSDSLDLAPEFQHVDPKGMMEAIDKKILGDMSLLHLTQKLSKEVLLITCSEIYPYLVRRLTMMGGYRFLLAQPGGIYSQDEYCILTGYVDSVELLSGREACVAYPNYPLDLYQIDEFPFEEYSFDDEEKA